MGGIASNCSLRRFEAGKQQKVVCLLFPLLTPQGGILAIDLLGETVATAGADHTVQLFDRGAERVLASLTGHGKRVTGAHSVGPAALGTLGMLCWASCAVLCLGGGRATCKRLAAWVHWGSSPAAGTCSQRGSCVLTRLCCARCARFARADVKFVGSRDLIASTSADKTLRLWRAEGDGYAAAHVFKCVPARLHYGACFPTQNCVHTASHSVHAARRPALHPARPALFRACSDQNGEVVSVSVHPTNDYLITAAGDGTWAFYDVNAALCLTQVCLPH